jgi:hypothetical protein
VVHVEEGEIVGRKVGKGKEREVKMERMDE